MTEELEQARSDLSNFPEEVIDSWLATFIESEGWPPNEDFSEIPSNRWGALLGNQPIEFWQRTNWKEDYATLAELPLDMSSMSSIASLADAYKNGRENEVSVAMGETGKTKFHRMLHYLIDDGEFPAPPILLSSGSQLIVMDGYHRFAAYVVWSAWQNDQEFLAKLGKEPVGLKTSQRIWIVTPEGC